jgi:pimeloyl-ACP methyl ester carboxylesterase
MVTPLESKYIEVQGLKTHYLEAGQGAELVLVHGGEFGAAAEITWEYNLEPLAEHFHVIAPDMLGYGYSDKVFDFAPAGLYARRIRHLREFLVALGVESADFMGNSMGAGYLLQDSAERLPSLPIRRLIAVSGGGESLMNDHRRGLYEYDGTLAGMRRITEAILHDRRWSEDEAYLQRRVDMSLVPGAWQCTAAPRFKPPFAQASASGAREPGRPDTVRYEDIRVPTLIIAGANDLLRVPGYAGKIGARIPDSTVVVIDGAGHCLQIEKAEAVNSAVIEFLLKT